MEFPNKKAHSIQIINTCWALAQSGVEVILIVSKLNRKNARECLDFYGLTNHPNLHIKGKVAKIGRKKFNFFMLREAWKYRADKNTVLFFRDKKLARMFIAFKPFLRIPCVIEDDAPASGSRSLWGKFTFGEKQFNTTEKITYMIRILRSKNLEKFIYKNADGIICQSKGIEKVIHEDFPLPVFTKVVPCATKLMDREFENKAKKILYLGHLYPQKGVDVLIEALKYLPNRKLYIVGGNKKTNISRLKKLISRLGVSEQVVFAGCVPHSDIEKYFEGAGVAVIPIKNTLGQRLFTSPMKLFEYMSARIPIVASDFPSMREILENGNTAVLVKPEDPKALAEAIEKLLTDREFAGRIAGKAYEKVKDFTWEKRAKNIIRFIEHIIKK